MTEQFIHHEYNGLTGEVTLIPYTDEQIAEVMVQRIENEAKIAAAEQAAVAKAALLAKLGITAEEAKLLIGGN